MILECREGVERLRRIAQNASIVGDEGDARAEPLAHAIGFLVEERR